MKNNQRDREEGSPNLSDIMHVLRLQRRHVQPELARWFSRRDNRDGGDDDANDNEAESTVDNYLMVLYRGATEASEEEEEEDEHVNVGECNVN
jgi:hypothetical protein